MAGNQYKLRFASLDKDAQKAAFIAFLKTQSEFANFNENASGWATLLDMLAYNNYWQAINANFAFSETFLDTASKRENVVSRAIELGYTPYSKRAAKASLTLTATSVPGNPTSLVLPAGSSFSTTVDNVSYTFVTLVPYSAVIQFGINNQPFYTFNIDVYEGVLTQNSFTLGADPSVDIMNLDIDTTTLRVFVTLNITEYEFYQPTNFLTITPTNKVYFLVEGTNAYKIGFGDNTFGLQPPLGSAIRVQYLVTSGAGPNGASVFTFTSTIPGATTAVTSTTVVTPAAGGAAAESIDSIKGNSVNYFATQDRAVTKDDYKALIIQSSPNVKDALVWGGEDNNPPKFGKVIACVLPSYGDSLTNYDKTNIQTIVAAKAVPGIGIEFTQPSYLNLTINTTVTYDANIITTSIYDLQSAVQASIASYVSTNLTKFNGRLRSSQLSSTIDRTDASIISSFTEISFKYKYTPSLSTQSSISFSFKNQLNATNAIFAVKSTLFYVPGFTSGVWIEDDTQGKLNLFYTKNGVKTYAAYNIGTVNYQTGDVYVASIFITGIDGLTLDFIGEPAEADVFGLNDVIVRVDSQDITVSAVANK